MPSPGNVSKHSLPQTSINFSTSGDQTIITGVTGQMIRIVKIVLSCAASTNLTFKDGATARTGAMPTTGMVLDLESDPITCSPGNSFVINSSVATQVGGYVSYVIN